MVALTAAVAIAVTAAGSAAAAPLPPSQDPFYAYSGAAPLREIPAGTVLKTRKVLYHVLGVPIPVSVVQLLYRTVDAQGQPAVERHLGDQAAGQREFAQGGRLRVVL